MGFLSQEQLDSMGFAALGQQVLISDKASIYNPAKISIGSHVRIDDFAILSAGEGGIWIGSYIHIACFCSFIGRGKIVLSDFSNISSRVSLYSSSDDFSGCFLTSPLVSDRYKKVRHDDVYLDKHVIVGSGCVILPGVRLEEGVAVGALSLVNKDCAAFGVYCGTPAKRISERQKNILKLEQDFLKVETQ